VEQGIQLLTSGTFLMKVLRLRVMSQELQQTNR